MKPKISLVTLGVDDLARAKRFYAEGLGLPLRPFESDEVAFFALQGTWLGLFGRDSLAADSGVDAGGTGFGGITLAHNVGSPEEVDDLVLRAERAGARVTAPPAAKSWGGYAGVFADPDGHLWEVAWNPHFDLT